MIVATKLFFQLLATIFLFRFYLRFCQVGGAAPVASLVAKVTNPVTRILSFFVPSFGRFDIPALLIAVAILWVEISYWYGLQGAQWNFLHMAQFVLREALKILFNITFFTVLLRIVMSWIRPADQGDFALQLINPCSDWILGPIQRFVPPLGVIDLSPVLALIGLQFVESMIMRLLS